MEQDGGICSSLSEEKAAQAERIGQPVQPLTAGEVVSRIQPLLHIINDTSNMAFFTRMAQEHKGTFIGQFFRGDFGTTGVNHGSSKLAHIAMFNYLIQVDSIGQRTARQLDEAISQRFPGAAQYVISYQ